MGRVVSGLVLTAVLCAPAFTAERARGTLTKTKSGEPALETAAGETLLLEGDRETEGVIRDERLQGSDFEVSGKRLGGGHFLIGPIHKKSMWVWKDGHRYQISYWCELCSIRTFTPGICMCCQEETALELRKDDEPDHKK